MNRVFISLFFSPDNSEVLQWARKRKIPSIQHDALLGLVQFRTKYSIISIVIDDNNSSVALFFK